MCVLPLGFTFSLAASFTKIKIKELTLKVKVTSYIYIRCNACNNHQPHLINSVAAGEIKAALLISSSPFANYK